MFFKFKYHKYKIFLFLILMGCQLQEPIKNHGILYLENRSDKLTIKESNKNDVIKVLSQPHSISINDENLWLYLERSLSKGKYHKLGRHVLKENNVLVLNFDKYGVLKSKDFYNKNSIKKVSFSNKKQKTSCQKKVLLKIFYQVLNKKCMVIENN